jgi:hypothetical protein
VAVESIDSDFSQFLRLAFFRSPNYIADVSGWTINQDGSAEFNNGVFRGTISNAGTYIYTGVPAAGNLVYSIVPGAVGGIGADPPGLNRVITGGAASYATVAGQSTASLHTTTGILFYVYIPATNSWAQVNSLEFDGISVFISGTFGTPVNIGTGGGNRTIILGPSGESTGFADTAAISSALAYMGGVGPVQGGGTVELIPGRYFLSRKLTIPPGVALACQHLGRGTDNDWPGYPAAGLYGAVLTPVAAFADTAVIDMSNNGLAPSGGQLIRGITIDGRGAPAGVNGISAAGWIVAVTLEHVLVDKVPGTGIIQSTVAGQGPDDWYCHDVKASACGTNGFNIISPDTWWTDCESSEHLGSGNGWVIGSSGNSRWTGCKGENNAGGFGFFIQSSASSPLNFSNCTTQFNNKDGWRIENGTANIILDSCRSHSDGNAGGQNGFAIKALPGRVQMGNCMTTLGVASYQVQYGTFYGNASTGHCVLTGCHMEGTLLATKDDGTNTNPLLVQVPVP